MPAEEVTKVYMPFGLIQTSLSSRLCNVLHGRHIKDKRNQIGHGNFNLDSRSHKAGYAAFTPSRPMTYSNREPTPTNTTYTTRNTREKSKITLFCMQKGAEPSQARSGARAHHTKPDPKNVRVMPLYLRGV
jgi:hypothetical protein